MTKFLTPAVLAIAAMALSAPTPASAGHDSPLYEAACNYRETAKDFERVVDRSRYSSRLQRDLADDLEDASSDLRSAARRLDRPAELITTWQQIQLLQSQVETVIFGNPNCPSRVDLLPCWQNVLCAANEFEQQLPLLPPCETAIFTPTCSTPFHTAPIQRYRPQLPSVHVPPARSLQPIHPIHPTQPVHPTWNRNPHPYRAPSWQTPAWNSFPSTNRYNVPSRSHDLHRYDDVRSRGQSFSPSERQLHQTERQLQRQPSYRQWDSATLGALISRLID